MKNWLSFNKISLLFLTVIVFTILFLQTTIPLWRNHLIVDIWFYFERARHFFTYQTLSSLTNNEHLPGALFYFFLASPIFSLEESLDAYTGAFFLLGFIFLAGHVFLYKKMSGSPGVLIFLSILLFMGPILFFRFELAVSLLVLSSIYFFKKKKPSWSSLFLGMATTIKIYPALILPYYLMFFFKKKQNKRLIQTLAFFLSGMAIVVGGYFLIGGSFEELFGSFRFHALKPLGLESPLATPLILFFKNDYHRLPDLIGAYGVWGIETDFLPVDLNFFNFLPLATVFLFYLFIYFSKTLTKEFKIQTVFLIFLIFLIFSKNLNPQYLFWMASLVPFMGINPKKNNQVLIFFSLLLILLLTQYVYPILYTDLINSFHKNAKALTPVVYFLFLRNFLLLVLLVVSTKEFLFSKKS